MRPKNRLKSDYSAMTSKQVAALFKVSSATVSGWLDEGMPCAGRRARQGAAVSLDLQRIAPWIATRRSAKPDAARVNVSAEQAEKLRLENAVRRGELLVASAMWAQVHEACASLVQVLAAMPQRVSTDAETQAKIAEECRSARDAFAGHLEALAERQAELAIGSGHRPRAAQSNGSAVG
ncbi:MAG: hypothetical protein ACRD3Q_01605 [Terriglobales bacterium]